MFGLLLALTISVVRAQDVSTAKLADRFEQALERVRADRGDLDVRPARWDTRFTSPGIEELLSDPLGLPDRSAEWGRSFEAARGASGLAAFAASLLQLPTESPRETPGASTAAAAGLPPELAAAVSDIAIAAARARPFLALARAGLSVKDQDRLTEAFMRQLVHGPAERLEPELFEVAGRFDRAALLQAVRDIAEASDRAVPLLRGLRVGGLQLPRSVVVAGSTVTLGGAGDDEFSEAELAASTLVVDLGGANRYDAAPAAAGPGEIKVVIDLGAPVIDSSGPVATGRFGIGLLYLPSDEAGKRVRGGNFSLGAGFFGAGLLSVRGDRLRLDAGDFSQGAAAFGLGALDVEGKNAAAEAATMGQGFAFTGGVGLFRLKGKGARLTCGLAYPDPRDEVAAISLCQGVGYGPRAFAAGGFGLASVESDGAELYSNYFAQGAGYWHSFGALYFAGDGAKLQSRRYGQGAGVHTALGALHVAGSRNRVLHWGVGPAFGWDWGTGFASVIGDENRLYADWAAGRGDVNGHGLLFIDGRANELRLVEAGTGIMKRAAPSYGVVVASGAATRVFMQRLSSAAALGEAFVASPWGVIEADGSALLDPALSMEGPSFRSMAREREEAAQADRAHNAAALAAADKLPAPARLARWLFLSSEGGLDGRTPGEAFNRLLSLPAAEAALLPGLLSADRFDEFLILRNAVAAYGRTLAPHVAAAIASASGLRKALLVSLLRACPAEEAVKGALGVWKDRDWRVRRESIGTLGSLLDREGGEEPGRLAFLEEWLAVCRRKDPAAPLPPETIDRVGQKRPSDLLAALALDPASTVGERLELWTHVSDPFGPVPADALNALAAIWGRRPAACRAALERELNAAKRLEPKVHDRAVEAVHDPSPDILPIGLVALGQLGRAKDGPRLAAELDAETAAVREAAASALGRLGKGADAAIGAALASSTAAVRAMAVLAAAESTDPDVFRLLARGFADPDETVRSTAAAAPFASQVPLNKLRKEFVPALERLAASDPSREIRNAAAFAAASLR